jgi:hypothetical protein
MFSLFSASRGLGWIPSQLEKPFWLLVFFGAGDRFRTDDLVLGKHTLYQLSYTRPQALSSRGRIDRFIRPRAACQTAARRADGFIRGLSTARALK